MAGAPSPSPGGNFSFFLVMLDDLTADDWYPEPATVPLVPRQLDRLAAAYYLPLINITDSYLNKAGWVGKIYVHFGCGGLFEFDPKVFRMSTKQKFQAAMSMFATELNFEAMFASERNFEIALKELFKNRRIVKASTGEIIAHEIITTNEVNALYEKLRRDYLKFGCVCGPNVDARATSWDDLDENFITLFRNEQHIFLFGNHPDFLEHRLHLVNQWVQVSRRDREYYRCVDKVVGRLGSNCGLTYV